MRNNSSRAASRSEGHVQRDDETINDSLKPFAAAKRKNKRPCRISQSRKSRLTNREASLPKSTEQAIRRLCRWMMGETRRLSLVHVRKHSRTWTTENPQNDAAAKGRRNPAHVNILHLDKLTAFAYMFFFTSTITVIAEIFFVLGTRPIILRPEEVKNTTVTLCIFEHRAPFVFSSTHAVLVSKV